MNKEQERTLERYKAEGKLTDVFIFTVKNKHNGSVNPVPGSVISGFLDLDKYEITENLPEVENSEKFEKKKKQAV